MGISCVMRPSEDVTAVIVPFGQEKQNPDNHFDCPG